jgi:malate dehydrogenase (oxaloacetate-decarboxylating)
MGQAGVGTARRIRDALRAEGLSAEEVRARIFGVDVDGLLTEDTQGLEEPQQTFAQRRDAVADWDLASPERIGMMDVIRNARATVLIGVTGRHGLFDRELLGALASHTDRPVVLALSNPTASSECTPLVVAEATGGRGLLATGSPFDPVTHDGRTIRTAQCNNLYVFPGMGLGALIGQVLKVTDEMFLAVSSKLSDLVTPAQREEGLLLPEMADIRRVSREVALAVAIKARDSGFGRVTSDEHLAEAIARAQWDPHYYPYRAGTRR